MDTVPPGDRLLRRREVERLIGLSRTTIYGRLRDDPDWPKPIRISTHAVAWLESEVRAWMQRRVDESRRQVA